MLPKLRKPVSPRWQPRWEDLTDADRMQFKAWCEEIKALIEVEIVNYHLVGSRAKGTQELDSDYDVVFVPSDEKHYRTHPRAAQLKAKEISEANGISLFIGIGPSARNLPNNFKDI